MGSQEDEDVYDITLVLKEMPFDKKEASKTSVIQNLALVFTKGNIAFNEWTRPICVFNSDYIEYSLDHDEVIWSGWNNSVGKSTNLNMTSPLFLQESHLLKFRESQDLQTDLVDGSGVFKVIDSDDDQFYFLLGIHVLNGDIQQIYNHFYLLLSLYAIDQMRFYVENGRSSPICVNPRCQKGYDHTYVHLQWMEKYSTVLEYYSTMNPSYEGGSSLLHIAARVGNRYIVEFICDDWLAINNQSVIPIDDVGITPIHEAYFYGHYDLAKYILKKFGTSRNQAEDNIPDTIIVEVEEMIDSTESGNFTGEPMEILGKLTNDYGQTVIPYTEMIARNLLIELRQLFQTLDLSSRSRSKGQTRQLERFKGSFVFNTFEKLSLMENLTEETTNQISSVASFLIRWGILDRRRNYMEPYIGLILKTYSKQYIIPGEVWTKLQEVGM